MSHRVLGFILLLAVSGWPFLIVRWVCNRLFPGAPPPRAADRERIKVVRAVHPAPDIRPRPVPVAAAPRDNIAQLSPEQRSRLSEWITTWSRLRVDDGIDDQRGIEDAILRRYEGVDEHQVRFQWVASPGAAVAAGIGRQVIGTRMGPAVARSGDAVGYRQLYQPPFQYVSRDIQRELQLGGSVFGELLLLLRLRGRETTSSRSDVARLRNVEGIGAAFDRFAQFHACCRDVLGVRYDDLATETLDASLRTARCLGWWWANESVCVVSERPTVLHRDGRGRLHHPTEAAARFRDGFSAFAWHGVAVPDAWITSPETLSAHRALTWPDLEQRRAALEIIGWKRVVAALEVRAIDTDADPAVGQLVEAELPRLGRARFLKVRCGTGRDFVLAVPRSVNTAREANAWTYDLSPAQYRLEART
ncbi:MAG TPA: hypothetical protein VIF57_20665 [Polyangia bacterium]|jgi:hypothetical protein